MAKAILNQKEVAHLKRCGYKSGDIRVFKSAREYEIETKIYNSITIKPDYRTNEFLLSLKK